MCEFVWIRSSAWFLTQLPASGGSWNLGGILNFLSMCSRYYTDAIPPPLQSRMGGGPYFLSKTSDSHLVLEECVCVCGGGWMRRIIVAETNVGVDQGRQLYCLIHPAVWCRERWPGWAVVVVPGWSWGLECFCFSFSQILLALFSTAAFSCYTRNQELWLPWDGNPLKTWTYCGLFRNICWRCSFMTTIRFLEKRRNNTNERGEINEEKLEIAGMWHKRGLCCQKRLQSWD